MSDIIGTSFLILLVLALGFGLKAADRRARDGLPGGIHPGPDRDRDRARVRAELDARRQTERPAARPGPQPTAQAVRRPQAAGGRPASSTVRWSGA